MAEAELPDEVGGLLLGLFTAPPEDVPSPLTPPEVAAPPKRESRDESCNHLTWVAGP